IGRNTQGVKLINLNEGDKVYDITRIVAEEEDEELEQEIGIEGKSLNNENESVKSPDTKEQPEIANDNDNEETPEEKEETKKKLEIDFD
ncbi:MAG: hypothetical protein KAT74_08295, partial [Candidatus Cloacimonetes bacterium]|nr:hypothetical protein [Candidatus Cloacimonadota bacterium]